MKKLLLLPFLCLFILSACEPPAPPVDLLSEFVKSYGAEGIIYHSEAKPGEEGYLSPEVAAVAFGSGALPESYAVMLNWRVDSAYECGLFLIDGDRNELIELSSRRISLLDPRGERGFIGIYGDYVFYSTLSDKDRAKRLASEVFR